MKIHAVICFSLSFVLFNGNILGAEEAAVTSPQEATDVRVETDSDNNVTFYFGTTENNGKWDVANGGTSTSCATGDDKALIWIQTTNAGKRDILAVVLTAISTGKKLVFKAGKNKTVCSGSGTDTYFAADYVLMK